MDEDTYNEEMWLTAIIFLTAGCIGFSIGIAVQAFDIVRCVVFPEMELFEFLQSTVNSMTQR